MDEAHQSIISIFRRKENLDDAESKALVENWNHPLTVKRNDLVLDSGQVETRLFFVVSGTLRLCYPHDADEVCVGFAYHGNLICSFPSFIRQDPSLYMIQALSVTRLLAISRENFYALFDLYPKIERAWRKIEEEALVGKIERETEMLTFSPEERYHRLMKRSPHIFQLFPRKHIASYLRMTPETLSRIRPSEKS